MYLIGASGHAKVIVDILKSSGVTVVGFFDRDPALTSCCGLPVLGPDPQEPYLEAAYLIAIGDNATRKKIAGAFKLKYNKAIHSRAYLAMEVEIGAGTVIMANAVINPSTTIGGHAIVNTSASIDHDCVLGDFVHVAPNSTLCGGINVGEGTLIGAGSVISPNISIGKWAVIGAGAVVVKDVPDHAVIVGNPGRNIKSS